MKVSDAGLREVYDFVIVGSGFGGSVCALRLAERGYRVLVLERGKRFGDDDFARSTWSLRRYLWMPLLRCFGILEITPFRDVWVLHGSGVGGGSLGYANVLIEPSDALFDAPGWQHLADWKTILAPHFVTAKRMLGVTRNPKLWPADQVLRTVAAELGTASSVAAATVGVFFGAEGVTVPDPYFGGTGPDRAGCIHCGGCMVGCRYNAKNTLPKNYLHFAELLGVEVRAEHDVRDITPVEEQSDGVSYVVHARRSTALFRRGSQQIRSRHVIVSAGTLGTLGLLFRCRTVTRSLPNLSARLGDSVRTNSEAIFGSVSRNRAVDYSRGVAIASVVTVDADTTIQPVRYPAGSSAMRFLSGPMVRGRSVVTRLLASVAHVATHPLDVLRTHVLPGWAQRATILLVMQTLDSGIRLRLGRSVLTRYRRGLVSQRDETTVPRSSSDIGRRVAERFAAITDGIAMGSVNEGLFGTPLTAHILGGCAMGRDANEGVVSVDCEVHGYPGLFVVDGSIVPANPGVNPSLTIAALAEYAAERIASAITA